jgi:hypothetical protein
MTIRRAVIIGAIGLAACSSSPTAPEQSLGAAFVVVTVTHASFSASSDMPTLTVDATIRNPGSAPVRFLPDCGGDFSIERWTDGQWVPWALTACRSGDFVTLAAQESRAATRSFVIQPGTFRLAVHDGLDPDRVAYSASFDAR